MNDRITAEIVRYVAESPANRREDGGRYFDEPLAGFAALDDLLFADYQRIIGPHHLLPCQFLAEDGAAPPVAGTVISWILPICREVRDSNRREERVPSRLWSHTRQFGEALNASLRRHLTAYLSDLGHRAAAPQLSPLWRESAAPDGPTSSWSERHAAYAAGLGTFSLNDGFITERGIAHRLGSVVVATRLPSFTAAPKGRHDNCLFHSVGRCGVCIARCPTKALSRNGHDKNACMAYVYGTVKDLVSERYGVTQTGCGLCQTAVPCEAINPCRN